MILECPIPSIVIWYLLVEIVCYVCRSHQILFHSSFSDLLVDVISSWRGIGMLVSFICSVVTFTMVSSFLLFLDVKDYYSFMFVGKFGVFCLCVFLIAFLSFNVCSASFVFVSFFLSFPSVNERLAEILAAGEQEQRPLGGSRSVTSTLRRPCHVTETRLIR